MSKTAYRFTVSGEYYARGERGGKELKFYGGRKFLLPEIVSYVEGREKVETKIGDRVHTTSKPVIKRAHATRVFQHYIRKYFIEADLRKTYPGFLNVRTMNVELKEKLKVDDDAFKKLEETPIADMEESQLAQVVAINDLRCSLASYASLADRRIAVERSMKEKRAQSKKALADPGKGLELQPIGASSASAVEDGILVDEGGAVTSEDGVPIDNQDPASEFLA